uniref:Putative secreted protein n=1 Tax=Xenopsylla cheopis TaxID=163159 RepID=A0A6M2E335_XENCH
MAILNILWLHLLSKKVWPLVIGEDPYWSIQQLSCRIKDQYLASMLVVMCIVDHLSIMAHGQQKEILKQVIII